MKQCLNDLKNIKKDYRMKILSKRKIMEKATNKKKHCFDIVYEWEDILAKELNCDIICRSNLEFKFDEYCRKI